MSNPTKAYLYALTAVLFWSTVATAFKLTLRQMDELGLLFISSFTATITLFIFFIITSKKKYKESIFTKDGTFRSALLGFLNPFLYYLILFRAYSILPAQEALTLNYTWAVMVVIFSIIILKQKINLIRITAIVISFLGVVIIAAHGDFGSLKFKNPLGTSLALGTSVVWALYWVYNLKDKREEVSKLFLNFLFGMIYIVFVLLLAKIFPAIQTLTGSVKDSIFDKDGIHLTSSMIGAVYIGLFEMGITFIFWLKALKYSKTTAQVSNLIFLSPFLSLLLINYILGEKILVSTIIGLIFVIIGIIIQNLKKLGVRG